ncbi:hypothetical protein ABEW00_09205 [Rossellomorea vietnamensis]|uniref:hypothetical protein n=1 Tax=Rossellomorea vietnamensis TaxID=218284 RepID=UPI003D2653B8
MSIWSIVRFFKKTNSCKCCCPHKPKPICPPATHCNEKPGCEARRVQFASDSPVALNNGWTIAFVNTLEGFPPDPNICRNTFFDDSTIARVVELENPFVQQELLDRLGSCSVVVWATNNGIPTLVKLKPGSVHPVKILPTPSLSCLAYRICINDGID